MEDIFFVGIGFEVLCSIVDDYILYIIVDKGGFYIFSFLKGRKWCVTF